MKFIKIIFLIFSLSFMGCSNVKKDRNMSLSTAIKKGTKENEEEREVNDSKIIHNKDFEEDEEEENTFFLFGSGNDEGKEYSSVDQYENKTESRPTELTLDLISFGSSKMIADGNNLGSITENKLILSTYNTKDRREVISFFISGGTFELKENSEYYSEIEYLKFFSFGISAKGYLRDLDNYLNPFFGVGFSRDYLLWEYLYPLHDSYGSFESDHIGAYSIKPEVGMKLGRGNWYLETNGFLKIIFADDLTSEGFRDKIFGINLGPGCELEYGVYFD